MDSLDIRAGGLIYFCEHSITFFFLVSQFLLLRIEIYSSGEGRKLNFP